MYEFENSIFINRPPHDVFSAITDPAKLSLWQSMVESAEFSSNGSVGVGSTMKIVARFLGRELETEIQVTVWEPPHRIDWKVLNGPYPAEVTNTIEPQGEGTLLTSMSRAEFGGFFTPKRLSSWIWKTSMAASIGGWKASCATWLAVTRRYLSLWLQWALSRPNSAFRDEVVAANHASVPVNVLEALAREMLENAATEDTLENQIARTLLEAARLAQSAAARREKETLVKVPLMPLEAVVDRFGLRPKESWLSSSCKAEKARGRRTLVYVRQTGTRDIQDRLESVLKQSGVQAITLYGSVDPRRRERWVEDHGYVDTLITNPRLVHTGLHLVSFQTVVFYEPEYSLYTLWQALRRVWRLGQTQPVKAVFAVYKDAMEAQALALMGRKMRAAQTLYGDEVGGAIVPVEDGDFITELAREVLRGAELDDLQSLFADEMQMSNSPMGCPTEIGPILVPIQPRTWDEWLRSRDLKRDSALSVMLKLR